MLALRYSGQVGEPGTVVPELEIIIVVLAFNQSYIVAWKIYLINLKQTQKIRRKKRTTSNISSLTSIRSALRSFFP